MWRTCAIVMCLCVSTVSTVSTASADGSLKCPTKSNVFEELAKHVRAATCFEAERVADACGDGIVMSTKLTDVATEVCRAGFGKVPEAVKEFEGISKRCEDKFGNRTPKKLDAQEAVAECRYLAAKLLFVLHR
ncbi:MAG: hypothetical protein KIT31_24845 [Deltaproteobacteria bacterium]|nr:hypothetical protein [Deltaproteobacteria bacterium]